MLRPCFSTIVARVEPVACTVCCWGHADCAVRCVYVLWLVDQRLQACVGVGRLFNHGQHCVFLVDTCATGIAVVHTQGCSWIHTELHSNTANSICLPLLSRAHASSAALCPSQDLVAAQCQHLKHASVCSFCFTSRSSSFTMYVISASVPGGCLISCKDCLHLACSHVS